MLPALAKPLLSRAALAAGHAPSPPPCPTKADARRAPFGLPLPSDRRLVAICSALEHAPDDDRTLTEWAANAGASARTLARLFIKETGLGFGEWRQRLRLLLSLDALEAGESVTRVALAHGYNSTSAFIAAFRGAFGASPGELRDRSGT